MPTGRTRLETLLRVRRIEQDRAKAELARANVAQRESEAATVRAREYYLERARQPPGGAVTEFLEAQRRAAAAAKSVVRSASAQEQATATTESACDEVRRAAIRSEGLQRVVDRAEQARLAETLAADQRTAEESRAGQRPRGHR